MASTKRKGDLGELKVAADLLSKGYQVAIPFGEDSKYDLIVDRQGNLERVQVKCTKSDGQKIIVPCRSSNNWNVIKYTERMFEWLAIYDITTDSCYYIPSKIMKNGRSAINLRIIPAANGQKKGIHYASDYTAM